MPNTDEFTPPKSSQEIRATLEAIHQTADVVVPEGPHGKELEKDFPITVACFYDREMARSAQKFLSQSGIFAKLVSIHGGANVVVDNDDHVRAANLLQANRERFPNRFPRKESRRFDFLIFGLAIGITIGFVAATDVWDDPKAIAIPVTFTCIGACFGHLLDRVRMSRIRTGRIRIGVWECLVAMAIPGMLILATGIIREIFNG